LGRIINIASAGKERAHLTRAVMVAIRELMKVGEVNPLTLDLVSFISLSLDEIYETVEVSVTAWEKRDYWVKADRFRMEWIWTKNIGFSLHKALLQDNWAEIASQIAKVAEKLSTVKIPNRHGIQTPWEGAWNKLKVKPI
jgi:hypothetical protein